MYILSIIFVHSLKKKNKNNYICPNVGLGLGSPQVLTRGGVASGG